MRYGIYGFGKLARAVEAQILGEGSDTVSAVFTRRPPSLVASRSAVYPAESVFDFADEIDCMLVCRGSANDLPNDTPRLAECFTVVDSYDNHSDIPRHLAACRMSAEVSGNVAIVGAGWDPGLMSLMRILLGSVFPPEHIVTFWGEGVSQGHSEAIRRIEGVIDAVQYTVPESAALDKAQKGEIVTQNSKKHKRVCYIAAEKGKESEIAQRVVSMPEYFAPYETEIHFVSESELALGHSSLHHRGRIIARGKPYCHARETISCDVDLRCGSNPELTAALMLAAGRAAAKLKAEGHFGAYTLADIPPRYLLRCDYLSFI